MKIWTAILIIVAIPIIVDGGVAMYGKHMNAAIVAILGAVMIYLAYNLYARRIDRDVIQPDSKKATPATLYMDGVDFMPTNRNVLYGYHFKSIAAAGPIVGVITAANLWGWLPSLLWLVIGVSFICLGSGYFALLLAFPHHGHAASALAHPLDSPRTDT